VGSLFYLTIFPKPVIPTLIFSLPRSLLSICSSLGGCLILEGMNRIRLEGSSQGKEVLTLMEREGVFSHRANCLSFVFLFKCFALLDLIECTGDGF